MRYVRLSCLRALLAGALLAAGPPTARAHNQTVNTLGGSVLCLDPGSVQLSVQNVLRPHPEAVRAALLEDLTRALHADLTRSHVPFEPRASCRNQSAYAQLLVEVRYLDPQNYVGFGDPAYSYSVYVRVLDLRTPPSIDRFVAGYDDIHSEGRSHRPFEGVLRSWGAEEIRDLAVAWHTTNPLGARLGSVGGLTLLLDRSPLVALSLGVAGGTALLLLGLLVRRRARPLGLKRRSP